MWDWGGVYIFGGLFEILFYIGIWLYIMNDYIVLYYVNKYIILYVYI